MRHICLGLYPRKTSLSLVLSTSALVFVPLWTNLPRWLAWRIPTLARLISTFTHVTPWSPSSIGYTGARKTGFSGIPICNISSRLLVFSRAHACEPAQPGRARISDQRNEGHLPPPLGLRTRFSNYIVYYPLCRRSTVGDHNHLQRFHVAGSGIAPSIHSSGLIFLPSSSPSHVNFAPRATGGRVTRLRFLYFGFT